MRLLIAFQAGLVDGVQHGSAQQSNAVQALHQQQADQLAAAAHLIMVHRDDILVSRAANGNKGDAAFLQHGDQRITLQRAGQNHAINLAVDQQTLHRACFLLAHHRHQHIIIIAGGNIVHGADGFAQKWCGKVAELAREHQ